MSSIAKTNWESAETWQRVVSSIIATGVKIDLRAVAQYYGTTYDTLENRFRKLKKYAEEIKKEVDSGGRGEVTAPSRSKSVPTTPRKPKAPKKDPLGAIANGRVTKTTPNKKGALKKEQSGDEQSRNPGDLPGNVANSFDQAGLDFTFEGDITGSMHMDDEL